MVLKRKSLAELHQEDQLAIPETPARPLITAPPPTQNQNEEKINNISEKLNPISEKRNNKSDYAKMSITVEPELFEAIQSLSLVRRKEKKPFTFSVIVRDALKAYLKKAGMLNAPQ
jgi:hypothetical protein